ncbi:MAG: PIN domain-containing protein [Acidobacteria bacterium]|nr:PIN domain-containing protein [Acidobacteriota bacterium]
MRIVLDTNVLVSALLSPFGAPARVLDLVLLERATLLFDERILQVRATRGCLKLEHYSRFSPACRAKNRKSVARVTRRRSWSRQV